MAEKSPGIFCRASDLGLVVNAPEIDDLTRMTIFEDELVLIIPPCHRLGLGKPGRPLDLGQETLILREKGSKTREASEAVVRERKIQVGKIMEVADPEAIKSAVRAGLGVSIISAIAVQEEVRAGTLVALPFLGGGARLRFEAVHRKDVRSPVMGAFVKALIPEASIKK